MEDRRNNRKTIQPASQQADINVHREVTLTITIQNLLYQIFSLVLVAMTFDAGLTYNADRAISLLGIQPLHTTVLLSIMGGANVLGKTCMGKLMDLYRSRIVLMTVFMMMVNAVLFSLGGFLTSWTGQVHIEVELGEINKAVEFDTVTLYVPVLSSALIALILRFNETQNVGVTDLIKKRAKRMTDLEVERRGRF